MISSPHTERRRRPVFAIALALSLLVHAIGGLVASYHGWNVLRPPAKPIDEQVALSDVIRIDRRPAPRPAQRAPAPRPPAPQRVPRRAAVAAEPIPIPTLAPPTAAPTAAPSRAPRPRPSAPAASAPPTAGPTPHAVAHATIHRPAAVGGTTGGGAPRHSTLSREQLAEMQSAFAQTIAQTRKDLTTIPLPPPTPAASRRKYDLIMSGKPADLDSFQGYCDSDKDWLDGPDHWHYLTCRIDYSDGYRETVSFPWAIHFDRRTDPFNAGASHRFALTPPPPGFTLYPNFQLSRAVCIYFKERCDRIFKRELQTGGPASAP